MTTSKGPYKSNIRRPSVELTERAVLHFVRWMSGMEVVQDGEVARGFVAVDDEGRPIRAPMPKLRRPASDVTYPKHPDLSQGDYDRMVTLLRRAEFVLDALGRDVRQIWLEDQEPKHGEARYRMPYRAASRLESAYRRIAIECDFYETVEVAQGSDARKKAVTIIARMTPKEKDAIRASAKAAGMSMSDYVRARLDLDEEPKSG